MTTSARRPPLARLVVAVVGVAAAIAAVTALMGATKNQPDPRIPGTASDVVFDVQVGRRAGGEPAAALALWGVCGPMLGSVAVGPVEPDGETWTVHVEPAVGEHAHRRLHGCIEDLTLPRIRGDLISVS